MPHFYRLYLNSEKHDLFLRLHPKDTKPETWRWMTVMVCLSGGEPEREKYFPLHCSKSGEIWRKLLSQIIWKNKRVQNLQIKERRRKRAIFCSRVSGRNSWIQDWISVTELDGNGRVGWASGHQCLIIWLWTNFPFLAIGSIKLCCLFP